MKYKIGDIVKVRSDLVPWEKYGLEVVAEGMIKYSGMSLVVIEPYEGLYTLNYQDNVDYTDEQYDDLNYWQWSDEMLED